jgi:hypothetical protein
LSRASFSLPSLKSLLPSSRKVAPCRCCGQNFCTRLFTSTFTSRRILPLVLLQLDKQKCIAVSQRNYITNRLKKLVLNIKDEPLVCKTALFPLMALHFSIFFLIFSSWLIIAQTIFTNMRFTHKNCDFFFINGNDLFCLQYMKNACTLLQFMGFSHCKKKHAKTTSA